MLCLWLYISAWSPLRHPEVNFFMRHKHVFPTLLNMLNQSLLVLYCDGLAFVGYLSPILPIHQFKSPQTWSPTLRLKKSWLLTSFTVDDEGRDGEKNDSGHDWGRCVELWDWMRLDGWCVFC